jgi:hypothetical protein
LLNLLREGVVFEVLLLAYEVVGYDLLHLKKVGLAGVLRYDDALFAFLDFQLTLLIFDRLHFLCLFVNFGKHRNTLRHLLVNNRTLGSLLAVQAWVLGNELPLGADLGWIDDSCCILKMFVAEYELD